MKYLIHSLLLLFLSTGLRGFSANAATYHKFNELEVKNYDYMKEQVDKKIRSAQKHLNRSPEGTIDPLVFETYREALFLILSRPNKDNMVAKLVPAVRSELTNLGAYQETMLSIANEAIRGIDQKGLAPVYKGTLLFVLENIMSELRPDIRRKTTVKSIFKRIMDAKIKVPKDVKNDRTLKMFRTHSPSMTAKRIYESAFPKKK